MLAQISILSFSVCERYGDKSDAVNRVATTVWFFELCMKRILRPTGWIGRDIGSDTIQILLVTDNVIIITSLPGECRIACRTYMMRCCTLEGTYNFP